MNIENIRALCKDETLMLTRHFTERMQLRGILFDEVIHAIESGHIIEHYPDDYPHPSCLLYGNGLHVVCGIGKGLLWIITVYRPDSDKWEADGRTRKGSKP